MAAVEVTKEKPAIKEEPKVLSRFDELFAPIFPASRFLGLTPLARLRAFSDRLDRVFNGEIGLKENFWAPVVEVQKVDGDLVITAELPGLRKEEVKVEIVDEALVIQGERKIEHKEDSEGFHRTERSYGRFFRSIPLPEGAKADEVKAELADGILKVTLPVHEAKKQVREVKVEAPAKP